jgi:hypothetical protein
LARGQRACGGEAVRLHRRDVAAKQARSLARVRRQHGRHVEAARLRGQQVESVGIEQQRLAGLQRGTPQRAAPVALPQSRSQRHDIGARQQWLQRFQVLDAVRHQFGARGSERTDVGGARGHADQSGAAAQRRGAGHLHRATETDVTADHQHMAVIALIGIALPRLK